MKKLFSLFFVFVLCLTLCSCGKSEAVKNVETLIDEIGEVTINSKNAIATAESAYMLLSQDEQGKVSNVKNLSSAKITYVKILINAIGDVTPESEDSIIKAEEEYDALNDAEKTEIENIEILRQARIVFERLYYVGEWHCISNRNTDNFTTTKDGKIKIGDETFNWEVTDDGITITLLTGDSIIYTQNEKNDVLYLVSTDGKYYVQSENAQFTEHEINSENWQDYFTLEQIPWHMRNGFGDLEMVRYPWVLSLKEEYIGRLVHSQSERDSAVDVEVRYRHSVFFANVYEENGEVIIDRNNVSINMNISPTEKTEAWTIYDNDLFYHYILPMYDVNAPTSFTSISLTRESGTGSYFDNMGYWYISMCEDAELIRIQGSILLYDKTLHTK